MLRKWYIYCLVDPRTNEVRYVGWAYNVEKRVRDHVRKARKQHNHKASWLVQLENEGLRPLYWVLESGTGNWAEAEQRWIAFYRAEDAQLTNLTDGGEGIVGYVFSAEIRARMSAAKRGRKLSPEHIEKVAGSLRGRKRSRDVVQKITKARRSGKGWSVSEETKEKIRQTVTGFRHTVEAKAKIAAAGRGRKHTDEAKRKQAEAKKGKPLTAEHKQKLSEAKRGRTLSDEHKQHIRESTRHPQRCGLCGKPGHKRSTCPLCKRT